MGPMDFDTHHNVAESKHFYQFYKHRDDYVCDVISYMKAGLEKGEACLWLASERMGLEPICLIAENMIPRFLYYLTSGQLEILSAENWYLKNGCFSEEQSLQNAASYVERKLKAGYHRIRGCGDAGAINHRDWSQLESYEKKVASIIEDQPLIALCSYPILECSLRETKMILDCHDDVLVGHL